MAEPEVNGDVLNFDNLVNIFSYITPNDLTRASRVCKFWNEAADISSLWKRQCFLRWSFCNLNISPGKNFCKPELQISIQFNKVLSNIVPCFKC